MRELAKPTQKEQAVRDAVMDRILTAVKSDTTIVLPRAVLAPLPADQHNFALLNVGIEANDFGGTLAEYRYQLEGEDDLLHLMVVRQDTEAFPAEEAQTVAGFVFANVPPALMWFKPGSRSHHFYLGHDVLLEYCDNAETSES